MPKPKCPVCEIVFDTVEAMRRHFEGMHRNGERSGSIVMTDQVPASTISGHPPVKSCESCMFWGKANNLTVCRSKPGVPALLQLPGGMTQCVTLYPPVQANEWCGEHIAGYWDVKEDPTEKPIAALS